MNKRIELTLQKDYIDWNLAESVRELAQNGLDAQVDGHPFRIEYIASLRRLSLCTEGVVLQPQTLLVGFSSKRDRPDQIGKFGEGYKLALLALVREGHEVIIRTGNEEWIPAIEPSAAFGGEEVLVINVRPMPTSIPNLEIDVSGVSALDWEEIRSIFLLLNPPDPERVLEGFEGEQILLEDKYMGKIFVGGIYVQTVSGFRYGYNFRPQQLNLDRDRRMVDTYILAEMTSIAWGRRENYIAQDFDLLWSLIETKAKDVETISSSWCHDEYVAAEMVKRFQNLHGVDAVPVDSSEQMMQLSFYGAKGVIVPTVLFRLLNHYVRNYYEVVDDMQNIVAEYIHPANLTDEERTNLNWAIDLLKPAYFDLKSLVFVGLFHHQQVNGFYVDGRISLNRSILDDPKQLLTTLIHELAHRISLRGDGTVEHTQTIQRLWANLAYPLLKGPIHGND